MEVAGVITEQPVSVASLSNEALGNVLNGSHETAIEKEAEVKVEPEKTEPEKKEPEALKTEPVKTDTFSREDYDKLLKKAENQDKLLARLGTEMGLLRKQTPEDEKRELDELRDLYLEDPIKGHAAIEAYNKRKAEAKTQEDGAMREQAKEATRGVIGSALPEFEKSLDLMGEVIAMDGATPEDIKTFKADPYRFDSANLYNIYKRAEQAKENKTLREALDAANRQIDELKEKPGKMLESIEKATKSQPLTAKAGGTSSSKENFTDVKSIRSMSSEELKKFNAGGK